MLNVLGASRARLHALSAPAQRSAATEGSWAVPVPLRSPPAGSRSALGLVADTSNGSRGDCAQRGDTRRRWAGQGGQGRESRQRAARRCGPSEGSGWRCSSISWGGLWGLNLQLDRIWSQMRSQRRASSLVRLNQSTQRRAEGRGWPPVARRRRPQRPRRSARPSWRLAGRAHPWSPSIRDLRSSTERVSRQLKGAASRAHFGFLDSACQAGNENRKCARHGAGWSGHLRPELGGRTLSAAAAPSTRRSAPNRAEPRPQSAARVARPAGPGAEAMLRALGQRAAARSGRRPRSRRALRQPPRPTSRCGSCDRTGGRTCPFRAHFGSVVGPSRGGWRRRKRARMGVLLGLRLPVGLAARAAITAQLPTGGSRPPGCTAACAPRSAGSLSGLHG